MRGPITNYRVGRWTHRKYEKRASRSWKRGAGLEHRRRGANPIRVLFRRAFLREFIENSAFPPCARVRGCSSAV